MITKEECTRLCKESYYEGMKNAVLTTNKMLSELLDDTRMHLDLITTAEEKCTDSKPSHNNDCTATAQEPSPKSPKGDFVQS